LRERPLAGNRIAITRALSQSGALREPLEALGADVVEVPTIEIHDPPTWVPLDDALHRLDQFDFLILTSVNGVEKLVRRLAVCGLNGDDLAELEVGAIGPATAAGLERHGVRVDFVPKAYRAEGIIESLEGRDLTGRRFLIPRARVARDLVPRVLAGRGALVEVVEAYYTVLPRLAPGTLERLLTPPPDLVTFTSSSTATNFTRLLEARRISGPQAFRAASIGPITTQTARDLGFNVVLEAAEFTIPGLVAAIVDYFSRTHA
jgi:uroporphyrinogen III methyltransferase / synthase